MILYLLRATQSSSRHSQKLGEDTHISVAEMPGEDRHVSEVVMPREGRANLVRSGLFMCMINIAAAGLSMGARRLLLY
jgi:hypothetical protein